MYKLRPSNLKNIIANPYNYFKIEKDISNLEAVKNGIERENISYLLYEQLTENKDYQKQVKGSLEINQLATIEGTCDILATDAIIDIKNSILDDKKLVDEYKYQLSAYCAIFNKTKAFLFVDANKKLETNINNCRLIEVQIIQKKELLELLNKVIDEIMNLERLNFDLIIINQRPELDSKLDTYFNNLSKIKELEKQNKELELELKDTVYENDKYSLHFEATRKAKRIVKVEQINEYENKFVISKIK